MLILGLDPGLRHTGWGLVEAQGNSLRFVACGTVHTDGDTDLASRRSRRRWSTATRCRP
jgi:crossover junction endodeoxyribonuclease RuvC